MIKRFFCYVSLLLSLHTFAQSFSWSPLRPGIHAIGFRMVVEKDGDGQPFLISIWYPAVKSGEKMFLKDYIETGLINGLQDKKALRDKFKHILELPFLYGIDEIWTSDYNDLLSTPVAAKADAVIKKGKWPLVISNAEPVSHFITNEWLASHGFVVAVLSTQLSESTNDSMLYDGATQALERLLQYMIRQPFVDTANISALVFGGGIQPAFYLSMRTKAIKSLVNLEGGVFGPRSKTTLSKDYNPAKFAIPLLHIVRTETLLEENTDEFNAIKSAKYRVVILPDGVRHHDFVVYGRVVNAFMKKRGKDTDLATAAFTGVHRLILEFLRKHQLSQSSIKMKQMFQLEIY